MSSRSEAAQATWHLIRSTPSKALLRDFKDAVAENRLLIFSSAVAYRGLVAMIPLLLLGLALLGALGLQSTWYDSIRPAVDPHLQLPVARAIDFSVQQILSGDSTGLIVFASLWVLWNLSIAVAAVMQALNVIHDVRDERSMVRRVVTTVALAAFAGGLLIAALLVMSAAPLIGSGSWHTIFGIGRWVAVPLLLAIVVELLFRYAPAERPEHEWASAGSALVILVWLATSAVFVWWVSVANYKSATGNLTFLLTVTVYVFITSAIFLFGAQLDELLRKKSRGKR